LGLHAPHLIDIEAAQALRRLEREGEIDEALADRARGTMRDLDLRRHSHEPLLERVWDLRNELSAYDAVYLALAEAVEAKVLTCDRRLARAPAATGRVELVQEPS
jgi:predicted nucleic acid-binding protein